MSARGSNPFHFEVGQDWIGESACRGRLNIRGHRIGWDLKYHSNFHVTLSGKGWIGFSRTPHSDAVFSGEISLDEQLFRGDVLGYGLQGHNCGYRHRHFWTWTHVYCNRGHVPASTLEALVYEMPLGLTFRKAVLWHEGVAYEYRDLGERRRDRHKMRWSFDCCASAEPYAEIEVDGHGPSLHRLPYVKTNCSGSFEVANNSLARAIVRLRRPGHPAQDLVTDCGAVLEMVGDLRGEPETSTEPTDWPG